jgi:zinc transporter, ZIP family
MPTIELADILRVIALSTFAGGTSLLGGLIGRYVRFGDQQILFLTAFGAGILVSAAIFEMVIEAEEELGIVITLTVFVASSIIFTIADVIAEHNKNNVVTKLMHTAT